VAESNAVQIVRKRALVASILLSSGLAWFALWRWGWAPSSGYAHAHIHFTFGAHTGAGLLLGFVAGWIAMLIGMMLPTSIPLLNGFSALTRERRDHGRLVALVVAGYLLIWTLVGVVAFLATAALLRLFAAGHWLHHHAAWLGAATLVLAGIYQFTPLKYRCLEKCRSPFSFLTEYWTGRAQAKEAFLLGTHHGIFCVGCCWSIMALMFTVGAGSLGWMLLLGVFMAIEKNLNWGKQFARVLGFALLVFGLFSGFLLAG
jgi:predicted metal-binding membrane protein